MDAKDTHHRTLVRACVIVGGETVLARHLDVSVSLVTEWLIGSAAVPVDKFLSAVDIVLAHNLGYLHPREIDPRKYEHLWRE